MKILVFLIFFTSQGALSNEITWFPLPAANNRFITEQTEYGRMLWAFDYGHALIYEQLWRNSLTGNFDFSVVDGPLDSQKSIFEQVSQILANPPKQAPTEETLSPNFTQDFSWLMNLFSWTHKLHWVAYDVLQGETVEKAKEILKFQTETVYRRYPTLALPTQCKSMMIFMEGQPFSLRFRRNAPNSNGLIWGYHYYQLALYEALLLPPGEARQKQLAKILKTFKKMAEDPAVNVAQMPMAKKVSPNFYREFPELSAIFDNLHELHDVIGDILSISEPLKLDVNDPIVKVGVPDSIKEKIANDKAHVLVRYDVPEIKKKQMDFTIKLALDSTTWTIDCDKNIHD